ncbi:MAG: hypothetical protein ABFD98_14180 [Syntrophobacteraceae bacterium]|nr:hypothetical protein [Desulfobacteraceae bacterium]
MEKSKYQEACDLLVQTKNDYDNALISFSKIFRTRLSAFLGCDPGVIELKFGHPTRVRGSNHITCYFSIVVTVDALGQKWALPLEGLNFSTPEKDRFLVALHNKQFSMEHEELQILFNGIFDRLRERCFHLQEGYVPPAGI